MKLRKILNREYIFISGSAVLLSLLLYGCFGGVNPNAVHPGDASATTGLEYGNYYEEEDDGFKVGYFQGQPDGPNLVFIEGGRTVIGSSEEDIIHSRDNIERTVTVSSFYIDETEVANIHWLEYEYYIKKDSSEQFWRAQMPDTTVWSERLAYNDPLINNYYRYPGFRFFPVVGISWRQTLAFCKWRTSIVNRSLAINAGLISEDSSDGEFDYAEGGTLSASAGNAFDLASGVVLPGYRLPTEAEWEYAAKALIGTQWQDENQTHSRVYPWDGHSLRNPYGDQMGSFLANFKRGRGDYAGIAGKLNDGAATTTHIYDYPPNDFGLYNMSGNVNEWVQDVYRSMSYQDVSDLNPVRRDSYVDSESEYDGAYSLIGNETAYSPEEWEKINGSTSGSYDEDNPPIRRVRVYKGGSWADVAYWLSPGTRRYLFEDMSSSTIGFRCAMIRASSDY